MANIDNGSLSFEAIEDGHGRIILRTGDTKEVILFLEFADSANNLLQGSQIEIAKAMISAGVQIVGPVVERNRGLECSSYLVH